MLAEVNKGVNTLEKSKGFKRKTARGNTKVGAAETWQGVCFAWLAVWLVCALAPAAVIAQAQPPLALNPEVPLTYLVKPEDTLWDIAALYLRDPWRWQALWAENPQVENPHLIFPGDVLRLFWKDGSPQLTQQAQADIKLTPGLRASPYELAIPMIPREQIAPFLRNHSVVKPEVLDASPYVVSGDSGRLMSGVGDTIFTMGSASEELDYRLIRPVTALEDPVTGEHLGTFVLEVGEARRRRSQGDNELTPMTVTHMRQEIRVGDRLQPFGETDLGVGFLPQAPQENIEKGFLIAVADGLTQIGPMDIVVINLGEREALRVGDVLAIHQTGPLVEEPVAGGMVRLPDIRAGVLLVFAVYERASFGLVLEAKRAMAVGDKVVNP